MPGSPSHLTRRFFDVLLASPLTEDEHEAVASWLTPELADIFFEQQAADQRHGYHAAASLIEAGHEEREVVVTALMHDVGKRHSRLGVVGRTVASLLILFGLPLTERMAIYRDHGLVAARELAGRGAPSLAIDFAMHHHGERPQTIDTILWDALQAADQPPKARAGR